MSAAVKPLDAFTRNRAALTQPEPGKDFNPETHRLDMPCPVCGVKLIVPVQKGRGRPKDMHDECAELNRRLQWFQSALEDWSNTGKQKPSKNLLRQQILSTLNHHLNG